MNNNIQKITINDKVYPKLLKEISDPPETLYYRGDISVLNNAPTISVVGTRRCSEYGISSVATIVNELAKVNFLIISGMAKGIDTYAHKAALENGVKTIAVLGSGIDDNSIYPQRNVGLAHKIIESGGLIISEYEPGTPAMPFRFPERNRIVAGLSKATLVIEAPLKSGSMITARLALDYNRDVFAVPGSIFSKLSEGSNKLISMGAKCTVSANDILEEFNIDSGQMKIELLKQKSQSLKEEQKNILNLIAESSECIHIDKIIQTAKLEQDKVSETISWLILEDFIDESKANCFIIKK